MKTVKAKISVSERITDTNNLSLFDLKQTVEEQFRLENGIPEGKEILFEAKILYKDISDAPQKYKSDWD